MSNIFNVKPKAGTSNRFIDDRRDRFVGKLSSHLETKLVDGYNENENLHNFFNIINVGEPAPSIVTTNQRMDLVHIPSGGISENPPHSLLPPEEYLFSEEDIDAIKSNLFNEDEPLLIKIDKLNLSPEPTNDAARVTIDETTTEDTMSEEERMKRRGRRSTTSNSVHAGVVVVEACQLSY